jgi:hypothetical protein
MAEIITVGGYLNILNSDINEIVEESRNHFSGLSEEQFNWKANLNEWSVAQCLEHLRMNGISFMPVLDRVIRDKSGTFDDENMEYRHGFIGKRAIRIIGPESTRKFKTTKNMDPRLSNYALSALDDFVEFQSVLQNYIEDFRKVNIRNTIIPFPGFPIFRLSLGDMLKFIIEHEKRHIKQAKNVMGMQGFPVLV